MTNLEQGSLRTGTHAGEIGIVPILWAGKLFVLYFFPFGPARLFLELLGMFRALAITLRQGRFTGSRNGTLLG